MRALGERCAVGVENPDLRDWVRLLAPPQVKVASAAARAWVGGVGECGGEEAVGPLFGVADLEPGELVGEPVAVDVLQLVEGRVSGLDDEGGERELGESLQLEADRSVGERGREVVEALALDRGEDRPVWAADRVVAGGNGCPDRFYRLLSEAVGVALAGIDGDRDRLGEGASAGDPAARVGGAGGLLGLPEDRLVPLHLREDELGAGKPGTVEHEVDRGPAPSAEPNRRLLDDPGVLRPWLLEAVTVDARGRRPQLARLQHQPALERQPQQIGQLAVFLRVTRHNENGRSTLTAHAAAWYSWISPPSTSRRRISARGEPRASCGSPAGVASANERCGRSVL